MRKNMRTWAMTVLTAAFILAGSMAEPVMAASKTALGQPEEVYWEDDNAGIAHWSKVENAKRYEVVLYEGDGDRVSDSRQTVSGTKVDLREYMENGGDYYFAVRAVPAESQKKKVQAGEWSSSDYATANNPGYIAGRWREDREGKKFQKKDGTYLVNDWGQIGGQWYHFDENGYMQTGWLEVGGLWYYLNSDGVMQTGWLTLEDGTYYLRSDGSMVTGEFEHQPGAWYYFDETGRMQ